MFKGSTQNIVKQCSISLVFSFSLSLTIVHSYNEHHIPLIHNHRWLNYIPEYAIKQLWRHVQHRLPIVSAKDSLSWFLISLTSILLIYSFFILLSFSFTLLWKHTISALKFILRLSLLFINFSSFRFRLTILYPSWPTHTLLQSHSQTHSNSFSHSHSLHNLARNSHSIAVSMSVHKFRRHITQSTQKMVPRNCSYSITLIYTQQYSFT